LLIADPLAQGLDYLYAMQRFLLEPGMIDVIYHSQYRDPVCVWIGNHIHKVNAELNKALQSCHDCFHDWQRQPFQVFAVPIANRFGIDAFCNIRANPVTILVDVGRVIPEDWLALVAHEYAHAYVGSPGHHEDFVKVLTHLCLGLGFEPPPPSTSMKTLLRSWPQCHPTRDPLAFWMGK
jgi:hypothetical protein